MNCYHCYFHRPEFTVITQVYLKKHTSSHIKHLSTWPLHQFIQADSNHITTAYYAVMHVYITLCITAKHLLKHTIPAPNIFTYHTNPVFRLYCVSSANVYLCIWNTWFLIFVLSSWLRLLITVKAAGLVSWPCCLWFSSLVHLDSGTSVYICL